MCGIFALLNHISSQTKYNIDDIKNEFMKGKSRGPESSILENVSIDSLFGFHRLAINGLSDISNQPIHIKDVVLICNGEIYNYKQLYDLLKIEPSTYSDCEVIIHLYKRFGIDYTLELLDGVFSFILLDNNPENNCMYVARDPYGIRPLYYLSNDTSKSVFAFASEMKVLENLKSFYGDDYTTKFFKPGTYTKFIYPIRILSKWKVEYEKSYFELSFSPFRLPICSSVDILNTKESYKQIIIAIRNLLTASVFKRCSVTERPIACLLSGGLDSSIIASIICYYRKLNKMPPLETYSIGLEGSEDLKYAKEVSKFLKTIHTTVILSEKEFIDAIPEVIYAIESYDTTTVRASIGNYLIGKYISINSHAKVIFNGDGSDELFGGYLYFHKAPNCIEFDKECRNLLKNIHKYDVLRSDKSISSNGLEPRTPYLDRTFSQFCLSIPIEMRSSNKNPLNDKYQYIEKNLLRSAFDFENTGYQYLPDNVLWRTKEAFSDGVSSRKNSLYEIIQNFVETKYTDEDLEKWQQIYTHNTPQTKEQLYYRNIFESNFKNNAEIIPQFWMPKFVEANDPSARTLNVYIEENSELQERSL